jgi:hypothetical protein
MNSSDIFVWVHGCPDRKGEELQPIIDSLEASDAKGAYQILEHGPAVTRRQIDDFFTDTLYRLSKEYKWILRIEDDSLVHPRILGELAKWPAANFEYEDFGCGWLYMHHTYSKMEQRLLHCCLTDKTKSLKVKIKYMAGANGQLFYGPNVTRYLHKYRDDYMFFRQHFPWFKKQMDIWGDGIIPFDFGISAAVFESGLTNFFHCPSLVTPGVVALKSYLYPEESRDALNAYGFDPTWERKNIEVDEEAKKFMCESMMNS